MSIYGDVWVSWEVKLAKFLNSKYILFMYD